MLNQIIDALRKRTDLAGWTIRHVQSRDAQIYAVPQGIESQRKVDGEKFLVDVMRNNTTNDGSPAVGSGDAAILPGDDIDHAIDQAVLVASLVVNPVYGLPGPAEFPNVPLCDDKLQKNSMETMLGVMEQIQAAAEKYKEVRLTAAECFGEVQLAHLVNSRGIDVEQETTQVNVEFVLHGRQGEAETETFNELTRRRIVDLDLAVAVQDRLQYTLDSLKPQKPTSWQGPVVLRNQALTTFLAGETLNGSVIQTLTSAASKYQQVSQWEVGKTVFHGEVKGDPLTVWANRMIPFGVASNRFDAEGLPASRVELIHENTLSAFAASQRYSEYLQISPTGAFGNIELPAGTTPSTELLTEPYVEIVQFSLFNPDTITGDFATEIRFGYLVENGRRKPFKGGQLVGNYMDALADVRWSKETGFFGAYLGPHTARFNNLKISGA